MALKEDNNKNYMKDKCEGRSEIRIKSEREAQERSQLKTQRINHEYKNDNKQNKQTNNTKDEHGKGE